MEYLDAVEENLANWDKSLFDKIPIGGLLARNPVAHKWKTPFRCMMLREVTFWREHDLMKQSYILYRADHILGARILLRSGFETLATLTYLNLLTQQVLDGKLDFHAFGDITTTLLLGSRSNAELPKSINVMTVMEKCERRYPGLTDIYADLSESAHPSYEGLCSGYSKINHNEYETILSNRWMELRSDSHLDGMILCMRTFHHEYDIVWPSLFEQLEEWITINDERLEATKGQNASA